MTAQINDRVFHRKVNFELAGTEGAVLFDPLEHGLAPEMRSTDCYRGYHVQYTIGEGELFLQRVIVGLPFADGQAVESGGGPVLFGRRPRRAAGGWGWVFDGLRRPLRFTGSMLLCADFIEELYVHMGFQPPWKFRDVRELSFDGGRLTSEVDLSVEAREAREKRREWGNGTS